MKRKGFTLIELLMVIVILGLVMSIAVIGVTSYINNFRKKTYVKTALSYIDSVKNKVNSGEYSFKSISSIYYIPISCIELEKGGKSPYGEFEKGYVVITFDGEKENYRFYARDVKGFGIENVEENKLSISSIKSNAKEVVFELLDEKEVIESIDENTCNSELIMQPIPETKDECFEVDGKVIINYNNDKNGCGKVVSIPKEINNVKIEVIAASAFASKKLEKVILSDYITEIGDYAFDDNNLTSINIVNNVETIGINAFSNNNIKDLIIGNNVKVIGESAFQNNEIISLKLGTGITKIEPLVFQNNFIATLEIPEKIKEIGEQAFFNNKLETIKLSNTLKSIGQRSFANNELISIEIPSSVNYIGAGAFTNNKLEKDVFVYSRNGDGSINYSEINSYAGKERKNVIIPTEINGIKIDTLGERSFAGCFIENITIPDSIKVIKNYSFHGNSFTSVTLPPNLKEIGNFAFWGTPIKELEIPNRVVEIGSYFIYETQIKRITIPNSVLKLSSGAFKNTELDEIIIDNKKGVLEGYPWGLESNFDRIKFLR